MRIFSSAKIVSSIHTVREAMEKHPYVPLEGDKLILPTDDHWSLAVGEVVSRPEGLAVSWEPRFTSTFEDNSQRIQTEHAVVYNRNIPVGTRIRHLGRTGQAIHVRTQVTCYLLDQYQRQETDGGWWEDPDHRREDPVFLHPKCTSLIILPRLSDKQLLPVLRFSVGDAVVHKGWVGVVTGGTAAITYCFENSKGVCLTTTKDLESFSFGEIYVGKRFMCLSNQTLQMGSWSRGYKFYNRYAFKNRPAIVVRIKEASVDVLWIKRIRGDGDDDSLDKQPMAKLEGGVLLASVFPFPDPAKPKLKNGSIHIVKFNPHLFQAYSAWVKRLGNQPTSDGENDSRPFLPFGPRHWVAVKVLYTQTVLDILFDDNSVACIPSAEIETILHHPTEPEDLPWPDWPYVTGDLVRDCKHCEEPELKYGFVLRTSKIRRTVDVNWVYVCWSKDEPCRVRVEQEEMSQYDVQIINNYLGCGIPPQFVLGRNIFEGTVVGKDVLHGQIIVQCVEGPLQNFYPHELQFFEHRVAFNEETGRYGTKRVIVPDDKQWPATLYVPNQASINLRQGLGLLQSASQYRSITTAEVYPEHSFSCMRDEEVSWEREAANLFLHHVEREVQLLQKVVQIKAQNGERRHVVVERVGLNPETKLIGLVTVVVIGTQRTIYENIPFFIDFQFPMNFWEWKNSRNPELRPRVKVRLPRVFFPNWIHPSISNDDMSLNYPDDCLLSWNLGFEHGGVVGILHNITFHFSNAVLCGEPYLAGSMASPVSLSSTGQRLYNTNNASGSNNNISNNNQEKDEGSRVLFPPAELWRSRDFNECALVALTDYVLGTMCHPPASWKDYLQAHYYETLSSIYGRLKVVVSLYKEANELASLWADNVVAINERLKSSYLIHPTSYSFLLAMENRLKDLEQFIGPR